MESYLSQVLRSKIFLTTLLAWLTAQILKVGFGMFREKRFNFRWIFLTGGMPSAHASGVTALTLSIGLKVGFDSPLFIVCLIFAIITLFDAQGVRRSAGRQAAILNEVIDELYLKREIKPEKVKEFLGHTPVEVLAGVALGVLVALVCSK